jgi:Metal binding domain of Ada
MLLAAVVGLSLLLGGCVLQTGATATVPRSVGATPPAPVPESWTDSKTAPRPQPDVELATPVVAGYYGSIASDKYHRPGCRKGSQIPAENLVFFPTVAAAKKAGYRACRICKPPKS